MARKVDWDRCAGEIERLYACGMSARDIAKSLGGVSKATVILYLGKKGLIRSADEARKLDIQQGKQPCPVHLSPLAPRILDLYKRGYSARMISAELKGVYTQPTINRFLRKKRRARTVSEALILARKLGRCKELDAQLGERSAGPLAHNWNGGRWVRGRGAKRALERPL